MACTRLRSSVGRLEMIWDVATMLCTVGSGDPGCNWMCELQQGSELYLRFRIRLSDAPLAPCLPCFAPEL